MKKFNYLLCIFIFGCLITAISSCKENTSNPNSATEETAVESGIEYDSKYICPMHCKGSGSESEGQCPVCGMDYVLNENYEGAKDADSNKTHEHDHDHGGEEHNHEHDHEIVESLTLK